MPNATTRFRDDYHDLQEAMQVLGVLMTNRAIVAPARESDKIVKMMESLFKSVNSRSFVKIATMELRPRIRVMRVGRKRLRMVCAVTRARGPNIMQTFLPQNSTATSVVPLCAIGEGQTRATLGQATFLDALLNPKRVCDVPTDRSVTLLPRLVVLYIDPETPPLAPCKAAPTSRLV